MWPVSSVYGQLLFKGYPLYSYWSFVWLYKKTANNCTVSQASGIFKVFYDICKGVQEVSVLLDYYNKRHDINYLQLPLRRLLIFTTLD